MPHYKFHKKHNQSAVQILTHPNHPLTMKFGELGQHISEKPACCCRRSDVILLKNDATVRTLCARTARAERVCAIFFQLSDVI